MAQFDVAAAKRRAKNSLAVNLLKCKIYDEQLRVERLPRGAKLRYILRGWGQYFRAEWFDYYFDRQRYELFKRIQAHHRAVKAERG